MELNTAQAVEVLTIALNTEEVETIIFNGKELRVTAFAELFTATEESVYRIIGLETTKEGASFVVIDDFITTPTAGEIISGLVFTQPIQDSFSEALADYSRLVAQKIESGEQIVPANKAYSFC